jgi:ankyrin repeat protein
VNGDLEAFENLNLGKVDYKMQKVPKDIIAQKAGTCPHNPTPLMLAVLCEQAEIVEFILKEKNPDLSITADGFNALHLSMFTENHKCFDLLLQTQYYQENIDAKIELEGMENKEHPEWANTALHTAVTQKNYYAVEKLLSPFPKIKYWSSNGEEEHLQMEYYPADINKIAVSGSTPLRIAVYLHDWKMICILLHHGADPTIIPDKPELGYENNRMTAYGHANELKDKQPKNKEIYEKIIRAFIDPKSEDVESTYAKFISEEFTEKQDN